MAGFLSSLFRGSQKESDSKVDWRSIDRMLRRIGVSSKTSMLLGKQLADPQPSDIVFKCLDQEMFKDIYMAEEAFQVIRPYINGKELNALTLNGFRSSSDFILGKMNLNVSKCVISDCRFTEEDWNNLVDSMAKGLPKEIMIDDISMEEEKNAEIVKSLFAIPSLEAISVNDCELRDETFSHLADTYIRNSSLKKIHLGDNYARDKGLIDVIKSLPESIEEFGLNRTPMGTMCGGQEVIKTLCQKLPELKNLKMLDLQDCFLNTPDIKNILDALPPSVRTINLKDNRTDDEGLKAVADYLNRPDVTLTTTQVWDSWTCKFSEEHIAAVKTAEEKNKIISMEHLQKEKAAQIAKARGEKTAEEKIKEASGEEIKGMLHTALQNFVLDEAFEKMKQDGVKLSAKELGAKNEKGETFVEACLAMKKMNELMKPELYGNAKDYQTVYEALPPSGQARYDGKDGRPSFQQAKNKLMLEIAKAGIGKRKGQCR